MRDAYRKSDPERVLYDAWPEDNASFITSKVAPAYDDEHPEGGGLIMPRFAPRDCDSRTSTPRFAPTHVL
jgi:hypothetical protein